jgi:hypothetical protein
MSVHRFLAFLSVLKSKVACTFSRSSIGVKIFILLLKEMENFYLFCGTLFIIHNHLQTEEPGVSFDFSCVILPPHFTCTEFFCGTVFVLLSGQNMEMNLGALVFETTAGLILTCYYLLMLCCIRCHKKRKNI